MKKCPSSIQIWDLKPQLLERESPPITTRPGLPPQHLFIFLCFLRCKLLRFRQSKNTSNATI